MGFIKKFENFNQDEDSTNINDEDQNMDADNEHGDGEHEGEHYKKMLKKIISNAECLVECIENTQDLPAWIQDKITICYHNLDAACMFLEDDNDGSQHDEE